MSTNSSRSRSRVPEGVPTGGQFAAERKAEAGPATLSGAPAKVPSMFEEPLRLDAARERGRRESARRLADSLNDAVAHLDGEIDALRPNDRTRTPLLVQRGRILTSEMPQAAARARQAAVLHAAADPEALNGLMDESDRLQREDPDRALRYGLTGHRSKIATDVLHTRGAHEAMEDEGVGRDCQRIGDEDVFESLPVGSRVRLTQLHGTGAGFTSGEQQVVLRERGTVWVQAAGRTPEGFALNEHWAVRDDGGRIILIDRETCTPMVVFHTS